jgi:hypothetical protein
MAKTNPDMVFKKCICGKFKKNKSEQQAQIQAIMRS